MKAPKNSPILRRNLLVPIAFVILVAAFSLMAASASPERVEIFTEATFVESLGSGELEDVVVNPKAHLVTGRGADDAGTFVFRYAYLPAAEEDLLDGLRQHFPYFKVIAASNGASNTAGTVLALILVGAVLFWVVRQQNGAANLSAQKSTQPAEVPDFSFNQLGGLDEAILEVSEVVDFLSDPERFTRLGAKPPRGVLLEGPPGTGKTALARAAAAEAKVPFFAASASEFVEMYVGVGARRVRQLFERAKKAAPAIVFIDEIDAVGRRRSSNGQNGNDERENTLNQLLTEIDGFFKSEAPVVVMAATNRSDILDSALMRRFTRHIHVGLPDRAGREKILRIHLGSVPLAEGVDVSPLAARTVGFSGSDLERLVNEAAVFAARAGSAEVTDEHLESAFDRIVLGLERRSAVPTDRDRLIVAYHEAGHTLCALVQEEADRPHKVSVVPRGQAGGVTHYTPREGAFITRRRALASLRAMMGGRAGEEVLLGDDITSGAAHDFQSASKLARDMVAHYGMGSLGPLFQDPETPISPETAQAIEADVARLLAEALADARRLVAENRPALEALVTALLDEETLDADRIVEVVAEAGCEVATAA